MTAYMHIAVNAISFFIVKIHISVKDDGASVRIQYIEWTALSKLRQSHSLSLSVKALL